MLQLPNFIFERDHEFEGRLRLGRMCTHIFKKWGLDEEKQQSIVIGAYSDSELKTLHHFAMGKELPKNPEIVARARLFVLIYCVVDLIYCENPERVESWLLTPGKAFGGQTPYEVIERSGLRGLMLLHAHVNQILIMRNANLLQTDGGADEWQ